MGSEGGYQSYEEALFWIPFWTSLFPLNQLQHLSLINYICNPAEWADDKDSFLQLQSQQLWDSI